MAVHISKVCDLCHIKEDMPYAYDWWDIKLDVYSGASTGHHKVNLNICRACMRNMRWTIEPEDMVNFLKEI